MSPNVDSQQASYLAADRGGSLVILCSLMIAFTTLAGLLRVWSRALLPRKRYQLDDLTALMSWIFTVACCVIVIAMKRSGFGHHSKAFTPTELTKQLKFTLAFGDIGFFSLYFSRMSILLFYRRVFEISSRAFTLGLYTGYVLNTAWVIAFLVGSLNECKPLKKYWDPLIPGHCVERVPVSLGTNITSLSLDLYIFLLPMSTLLGLQLQLGRKVMLVAAFSLGLGAMACSLGRLVFAARASEILQTDSLYQYALQTYWIICELSLSSISVMAPSFFYFIRRGTTHGPRALLDRRNYETPSISWIQGKRNALRVKISKKEPMLVEAGEAKG